MSIVNSQIIADSIQANNRRDIKEEHTDHLGNLFYFSYSIGVGEDATAFMLSRVRSIEGLIKSSELVHVAQSVIMGRVYQLNYNTERELRAELVVMEERKTREVNRVLAEKEKLTSEISTLPENLEIK